MKFWSILLGVLLIDASVAIRELFPHLHNKPGLLDIIPKPKLPSISIQVGPGSFGFGFGFGEKKPPKDDDHGKPDYPGTWEEKDDYQKPGSHGHDRYPEPHPHDHDRYPKPHPHDHDRYPKPQPHDHDRYPKPHPHDHDRYPKPPPHEHDRYPEPGSHGYEGHQKPGSYDHDKYPDDKKEYPKHDKDIPKPRPNTDYPKRDDKDSLPDWEDIGEADAKSDSLMEGDLVGDELIQPRNKRNKRYIEDSKIYHVPLMFLSNGLPYKVKVESRRRNMLRK